MDSAADYRSILVVIPNWVGDVVLSSPVLAALRLHFRGARISYLMKPYVREVTAGCGWHDAEYFWPAGRWPGREAGIVGLAARLRGERLDLALLLTNSFRSALVAFLSGARRRTGYARDGRGFLLTDRLAPLKRAGRFAPSPILPYYCRIGEHVGSVTNDRRLRLGVSAEQERAGCDLLRHYGLDAGGPYAVLNPGAAFGSSKCWPAERFAETADLLREEYGFRSVITGASGEHELMRTIARLSKSDVICCDWPGTTLGSLKVLVREAALLVCNDTGPRHYGAAFGTPTATIFGSTHQAWTDTENDREVKIQIHVDCGPCQKPRCPLDLRCLTGITSAMVMERIRELLSRTGIKTPAGAAGAGQSGL